MNRVRLLLILLVGCTAQPQPIDAGNSSPPDAGSPSTDGGPADVVRAPCPQGCDDGWACVEDQCQRPSPCTGAQDCPEGSQCSAAGTCFEGECLAHQDCPPEQRCREGQCLVKPEPGFILERVFLDPIENHVAVFNDACDRPGMHVCTDVGFGLALLDFDGDRDLDLFIGKAYDTPGSAPACLYRNQSSQGSLKFTRVNAHCQDTPNPPSGGHGIDTDLDGRHELLLTGPRRITLRRFYPQAVEVELLELLPENDPRRACNAGAAVSFDLNFDGHVDLLVGCQWDTVNAHGDSLINLAFAGDGRGNFRFLDRSEWDQDNPLLLHALGSTLALGAADLDDDGLLDLLVNEDEGTAIPELFLSDQIHQGGVYLRCPPTERCGFTPYLLSAPQSAFGGYMGSAVMVLDGIGEVVYFSNTGNNRMVRVLRDEAPVDYATRTQTAMGYIGSDMIFSWGIAVDDYNRDGRDDFLLTQGAVWMPSVDSHASHFDALFLQSDDARFTLHSADRGLAPFTHADSRTEERVYSSRALLKADLDYDGTLEFLSAGKEGAPRIHREVLTQSTLPPRCTLLPQSRYVPGFGVGYALVPPDGGTPRQWDSQGEMRSGTSPFIVTPWSTGSIRFPSGAVVPFDCQGGAGPVVVQEPEWLAVEATSDAMMVTVGAHGAPGVLSAVAQGTRELLQGEELNTGRWRLPLPEDTQAVMLRFGERWLPRWWERP